jgi:hypothetical protein
MDKIRKGISFPLGLSNDEKQGEEEGRKKEFPLFSTKNILYSLFTLRSALCNCTLCNALACGYGCFPQRMSMEMEWTVYGPKKKYFNTVSVPQFFLSKEK